MLRLLSILFLLNYSIFSQENSISGPEAESQAKVYSAKNFDSLLGIKGLSNKLMSAHFELYKGYVNQTNTLNQMINSMITSTTFSKEEFSALKKAYAFEFNGMKLHELFFENLSKNSILDTKSPFYQKILEDFGSYENWKKDFMQTGLSRGIGWVMCFYDKTLNRLINVWIESHDKGVPIFDNIIIIMDCWEHAYLQDFGIRRIDYIQTFVNRINWDIVLNRFNQIKKEDDS